MATRTARKAAKPRSLQFLHGNHLVLQTLLPQREDQVDREIRQVCMEALQDRGSLGSLMVADLHGARCLGWATHMAHLVVRWAPRVHLVV